MKRIKRYAVLIAFVLLGCGIGPVMGGGGDDGNGQDQPTPHVCQTVSGSTASDVPCPPQLHGPRQA